MIETEYWFRRQMGTICLLGELSIHRTQIIARYFYSSNTILKDVLIKWGQYVYLGNYPFIGLKSLPDILVHQTPFKKMFWLNGDNMFIGGIIYILRTQIIARHFHSSNTILKYVLVK